MTVLYIIIAALLLFLLFGYCLVLKTFRRDNGDVPKLSLLSGSVYQKYRPQIEEGFHAVLNTERQPMAVVSYDGHMLCGDFLPCENAKGTIVFFHGYRSRSAMDFGIGVPFYRSLGFNLLLVSQRAHGSSEGRWITFGAKERYDVISWVTYLSQKLGQEHPIYLGGISMGAATVLMASCFELPGNVRGIIADCGYTTPYEIICSHIRHHYPFLPTCIVTPPMNAAAAIFAGFTLKGASALDAAANANYPILFFHGTEDDVVPFSMAQQLFDACRTEKKLVAVANAAHGQSYLLEPERVQNEIRQFVLQHLS